MPRDKPPDKMFVHWWEDSSGRRTCHRNVRGLSAAESFLGEIRGNIHDDFHYKVKDSEEWVGPFKNLQDVCRALEKVVGGSILTTWD